MWVGRSRLPRTWMVLFKTFTLSNLTTRTQGLSLQTHAVPRFISGTPRDAVHASESPTPRRGARHDRRGICGAAGWVGVSRDSRSPARHWLLHPLSTGSHSLIRWFEGE